MIRGAATILIRKDGFVLIQHRTSDAPVWPNLWSYTGGGIEKNEDPESAAKRELEEETGYKAAKVNFLLENEHDHPKGRATRYIFWAIYDDKQEIQCNEGQEIIFVDPSTFDKYEFIPGQREIIEKAIGEFWKTQKTN